MPLKGKVCQKRNRSRYTRRHSMKPLSVSCLLILLSCVFLLNRASRSEKITSESTSSQAKQTRNPDVKTASSDSQSPPPEIKSRSGVNEPDANQGKTDSKKPTNETGNFDFLWANQLPNWINILGWIIAVIVAVVSLGFVARQANIADKSIKVADQGLRAVERPWLSITVEPKYTPKAASHEVIYVITNGGKTPAILKQLFFFLSISTDHLTYPGGERIPEQVPEGPLPTMATVFASESHAQVMKTHPVPFDQIEQVNKETMILIIHGAPIYDDVFGERHLTRFYQVYSKERKGFIFPRDADPRLNEVT